MKYAENIYYNYIRYSYLDVLIEVKEINNQSVQSKFSQLQKVFN